jgi:hypothetical protein
VVLRTPTFRVWESSNSSGLNSAASVEEGDTVSLFEYETEEDTRFTFKQTVPMEAQVGLVYKSGKNWIGAEGAIRPPLDSMDTKLLWNASLGGRLQFSPILSWGLGIFTDNSSDKMTDDALHWRANRYGFTTGLEFETPLTVKSRKEKKKKKKEKNGAEAEGAADVKGAPQKGDAAEYEERPLVWTTTIALSYSFEIAEYKSIVFDESAAEPFFTENRNGIFHHGFAYLGTALYF